MTQVVERLRKQIPEYSIASCKITDQPLPEAWPSGGDFCTVCLGDGSFPEDFYANGVLTKETMLLVTPFVRRLSDPTPSFEAAIVGGGGVVARYEKRILAALLVEGTGVWEPVDESGNQILRDQISPLAVQSPRPADDSYLMMTISFRIVFDWTLA